METAKDWAQTVCNHDIQKLEARLLSALTQSGMTLMKSSVYTGGSAARKYLLYTIELQFKYLILAF